MQELDFVAGEDAFSTFGKIADDTSKLRDDRPDRRLILATSLSACDLCHFSFALVTRESANSREKERNSLRYRSASRARAHEHNLELFSKDSEKEQVRSFYCTIVVFPKENLKLHFLC